MRIFLCGDVMTGRGIDQALPHPCDPRLHERYVQSAIDYVRMAEVANQPIPMPVDFPYIWGAALQGLERARPDASIINLETSITRCDAYVAKGINYRMSPENAECLVAAGVDCCVLGNNHVLDWGRAGLLETLATLERLQIKTAGAGRNAAQASAPAILADTDARRVLVFSFASKTSGVPRHWAATHDRAGVNFLPALSDATVAAIADQVAAVRRENDAVVVSLHWGPNWGYDIPEEQRWFAHELIDRAGISIVHGHSSHHAKSIEVYKNRLILYGCGDFLNDYEGIKGHGEFRPDLALMYIADLGPGSDLVALKLVPFQIRRFQLVQAANSDIAWLRQTLDRESRQFATCVGTAPGGRLALSWPTM
ncbi:poly-gamma-glutamate biosynthesis protein [Mesorhizobium sp. M1C.F.Ca.ET.193.01.1.1]|uniref:CapA family protein n=1 Tax=unclassified Mesorhizobium TaxID=325217 RepID=UPI000FD223B4|nr:MULTISPECIES: CapA family protein [unclassified Mesorhizobium]TGT00031.1 poly-gamma-glutamate biosynthesis protein [bacterium M00.F.Ca.ET.177.01.1.1]TGQ53426.1 poly-gamma-glutamate biosynthesis protein [Mesorhizobium sp. M1C.F.Ca.ET.210.01.1.1]TGQ70693.1 poly-gamma-glutamate biosynthesis protein [Mesorhizobium sp. M1C.F.Ca.ET.212.01.1.1]TGR07266.1 poly-gamma-glutamate biosynthesis protein [Mesorhizobium sp. M1C.F.Ca.ET.204.01.1.1]TGR28140.1 poly-gamma-glutamate biosynthesis protein [Mesorhi